VPAASADSLKKISAKPQRQRTRYSKAKPENEDHQFGAKMTGR
jgi:hypothetical protein